MHLSCRCIRCREVRTDVDKGFTLIRRDYEASGGKEIFLSFEQPGSDRLAALLRLRIPAPFFRSMPHGLPVLDRAALVRELHTYGWHLPIRDRNDWAIQHRGFGKRLMEEGERIAKEEFRLSRVAVIAGVGVREYYRRIGYTLQDSYMVKEL